MPVISTNNDVVTLIFSFATEPGTQQKLIEMMAEALQTTTRHQPGFVSASLHQSLDGLRVFNYAQWTTRAAYEAFAQSPQDQAIGDRFSQFPFLGVHLYKVVISKPEGASLLIKKGDLIHLGEFKVKPKDQLRLIELERENVSVALAHPDLLSASFHRSLDGTRTMNYGQWRSLDHFEDFLQDPRYEPVRSYWKGLAENDYHLYRVVLTEPGE
jgi:quinol monooxygenase YgiN